MQPPLYPSLYQINTRVWLTGLAAQLGRPATLDDIPDAELDRLKANGFDWIWYLSVWQTGDAGRQVSRSQAWDGNPTNDALIASAWHNAADQRLIVTVNYAPHQSQCYVRLPFAELANRAWRLSDRLGDARYDREGNDLLARGLYLDVPPWQAAVFSLTQRD